MGLPVRGFAGSIGFVPEVTWGTEVTPRTHWMRAHEVGLQRTPVFVDVGTLGAIGDLSTNEQHSYQSSEECGGRIVVPIAYQDASLTLFHHAMGATPVDAGGGPFTHTFKLASPPPTGLTMEQIKGVHASLSTGQEFYGCKINSMELNVEAGRHMIGTFDIIARSAGNLQSVPAPTYGTPNFVLAHHLSTVFTAGAVARPVNRGTLRLTRNLSRNQELGSLFTSEPHESRMMVELDLETLWQQNDHHGDFYAGTQQDWTWSFTSAALSMACTLHNARIVELSDPTTSPEGVRQSIKVRGYSDGGNGDQGLTIVVTNANNLFSAN